MRRLLLLSVMLLAAALPLAAWQAVQEPVPEPVREFRAAWVATVYNLDWPSRPGLPAAQQRAELLGILQQAQRLHLNAILLQVRPCSDAFYRSPLEPWSYWLSGPGTDPGYDPLAFAVAEAHKRGIELHAWFNPFRATASGKEVGRKHIARRRPELTLLAGSTTILNPSAAETQSHVLSVITDVVRRYDIDGVHLDDYFYPYPPHHRVADGKSPARRRAAVDAFVSRLYTEVKRLKPYVRVGISPFGIWQPGYPEGVTGGVNAYEDLACDARKWLARGWVDYLSPQLYWRCEGPQSFPALMRWWSGINPARPVWPGIASVRINSSEDPGRPASEIGAQVDWSRKLARQSAGQLYWSWRSLGSNRGGVQAELAKRYAALALPPPMPWSSAVRPGTPTLSAQDGGSGCTLRWTNDGTARKYALQVANKGRWFTLAILPGQATSYTLQPVVARSADRIALRPISGSGISGTPAVLAR
ncbi:MAG: glycoside hydrolase family 10 protein [Akkermansia sp.]